jgi:hypothetical protein
MKFNKLFSFSLVTCGLIATNAMAARLPSQEEMWKIIQQQQQEIEALKSDQKATDEKAEAAVVAVEESSQSDSGLLKNTQIGGYGELHYNNLDSKKQIDFHRFVLFFGHQFTDSLRFFSELEIEHAESGDGKAGEVELEQAYVEYDLSQNHHVKGGLFILPVGILNETHEPPTFYGVERNPVENNIIPSTWWAGGAAVNGELAPGWSYDVALHEGLDNTGYNIRSGRQKTSKANATDLAATGRIKWTGMPGLEIAASLQYQDNITQGVDNDASAWLYEIHTSMTRGPFGLRALHALWDIDGSGASAVGRDEQQGFYIEPSYKITPRFGVFARYNQWDNQAGNNTKSERKQYDVGVNFWPHPDVVLKVDLQQQDNKGTTNNDNGFNLGIGYQF